MENKNDNKKPKAENKNDNKELNKKKSVSVVDEVKRTKTITSKQLGAYQKATKGKAIVPKAKKNNGN